PLHPALISISSSLVCLTQHICLCLIPFFSFKHPAPPDIYTLSLHDALPILKSNVERVVRPFKNFEGRSCVRSPIYYDCGRRSCKDRKSTRLNSSHEWISYAVFCLKKKSVPDVAARCPPVKDRMSMIRSGSKR